MKELNELILKWTKWAGELLVASRDYEKHGERSFADYVKVKGATVHDCAKELRDTLKIIDSNAVSEVGTATGPVSPLESNGRRTTLPVGFGREARPKSNSRRPKCQGKGKS